MKQDKDCYIKPGRHKKTKVAYETHSTLKYLNFWTSLNVRELMFSMRRKYDACPSRLLCCVYWYLVTDVSGESNCSVLKGQAGHEYCLIDCLTFEDETDSLY